MQRQNASLTWTDASYDTQDGNELSITFALSRQKWLASWREAFHRLSALACLEDDWDNNEAEAPEDEIIAGAETLLGLLHKADFGPPSRITPSPLGAIVIEWQYEDYYLEAEIDSQNLAEWMQRTPDGVITHWVTDLPIKGKQTILMSDLPNVA